LFNEYRKERYMEEINKQNEYWDETENSNGTTHRMAWKIC
jgi:hypothetical protein